MSHSESRIASDRLRRMAVLRDLALGDLERLLSRSRTRRLGPKQILISEGDRSDRLYLILSGSLAVRRRVGRADDSVILAIRRAGEWVGETALLTQARRTASVIAETESELLEVGRDAFLEAVASRPSVVLDLLQMLVDRQRESDSRWIEELENKSRRLLAANRRLRGTNRELRAALEDRDPFSAFLGQSPAACLVREAGRRAAGSDLPVLLLGETGTGKEVMARAIHAAGPRRDQPFVALNCGLFTESMLENELFGHARGAFTGAVDAQVGLAEAADGGTLFLDEVGEMPPGLQVALLRFLETGDFRRLGETRSRSAQVRVVAATSEDLDTTVRARRFRADLLYRLDVIRISLPPLRQRRADIPLLLAHFNHLTAKRLGVEPLVFSQGSLDLLAGHDFPGNVRELSNEVQRLFVAASPGSTVAPEHLSDRVRDSVALAHDTYADAIRSFKTRLIRSALEEAQGCRGDAARILGLHPSNLTRMARGLGIECGRTPRRTTARRRRVSRPSPPEVGSA